VNEDLPEPEASLAEQPAGGHASKAWPMFLALCVVGLWIPLLCTAPQILGGYLWKWYGFKTTLPLATIARVGLNSLAVLAFIVLTKRSRLLAFERPRRAWVFLLFLPLMGVNVLEGPLTQAGAIYLVVSLVANMLVGFWEEFLFRGLVQERLSILGPRISLLVTAFLFAMIHANEGVIPVLIAFSIGLAFCVARASLGLWPLVLIHGTIDFTSQIFLRRWDGFFAVGATLVGVYGVVALVVLLRRSPRPDEGIGRAERARPRS
jgi:membrane protease YdiL (CAAX protease family)